MPEHQLDDPDVDTVCEKSTRAFVPEIVPAEVYPLELLAVPGRALPRGPRFDTVSEERRSRMAASRPSGLNGIRGFSLSLAVAPRNADLFTTHAKRMAISAPANRLWPSVWLWQKARRLRRPVTLDFSHVGRPTP